MSWVKDIKTLARRTVWLVAIMAVLTPQITFAINQNDIDSIYKDTVWYDATNAAGIICDSPTGQSSAAQAGPIYLVGDSIGARISSTLSKDLQAKGWQPKINALSSRTLVGGSVSPDGLTAVDNDQDFIRTANVVIIELGTNSAGFTTQNVNQMADKIHSLAPKAQMYWVDTAVIDSQRPADRKIAGSLSNVNNIIYTQSTAKNFNVISWNKAVFGPSAIPQNIDPNAKDTNNYIDASDSLGVHPNDKGITALSDLITSTVTGQTPQTLSGPGGSCASSCGATDSNLVGKDPAEQIWNYFKAKGLSDAQVAGIMGNIEQESTFSPTRLQVGGDSKDPYDALGQGYGLIQWTGDNQKTPGDRTTGDKIYGDAKAAGLTGPIYGLSTQLDLIWAHMHNAPPITRGDFSLTDFKNITDARQAATYFLVHIEGGSDPNNIREDYADAILKKYGGSNGGVQTSGGGCTTLSPDCQSANGAAKILCAAKVYDPISYKEDGAEDTGHGDPAVWHSKYCPVVNASCTLDCSGLVNIAVYDAFGAKLNQSTFDEVADTKDWQHIPLSQVQPGDLVQPASSKGNHVDIIDHVSGNHLFVFGAHTHNPPQDQEVGPADYDASSGDVYLHYNGASTTH